MFKKITKNIWVFEILLKSTKSWEKFKKNENSLRLFNIHD